MKDRCDTLVRLADAAMLFYRERVVDDALVREVVTRAIAPALTAFAERASDIEWTRANIGATLKTVLTDFALKMPQIAMPLRVLVAGQRETPSVDATLELFGRERVLDSISDGVAAIET